MLFLGQLIQEELWEVRRVHLWIYACCEVRHEGIRCEGPQGVLPLAR
jgi:hypothetical protein